jgi:dienelactone hydrolase
MRTLAVVAALSLFAVQSLAQDAVLTQQEFAPKVGSGRVVVVVSGQSGSNAYVRSAQQLADAGFDVVLLDGNQLWIKDTRAAWNLLKNAITQAQAGPHAQPGKAGVVGYSLGGGVALAYATRMPEWVETVAVAYPLTSFIKDPTEFVGKMKVPVLMMAGTADTYKDCCLIDKARQLEQAAKASSPSLLTLHEYAGVGHGFNLANAPPKDQAAGADAMERTISWLRQALPPTTR